MLSYPAAISLSQRTLQELADLIRHGRNQRRSRWRRLDPGEQALLVLAHLRNGDTHARLAAGFDISLTTAWRYVREGIDLLADRAPTLTDVVGRAARLWHTILDGTLIPIDRVGMAAGRDRPFYSGKHHRHGVNVQVLADPAGRLLWASQALPGATHDLTAARSHGLIDALADAGVGVFADRGYQGAGGTVVTPFKKHPISRPTLKSGHRAVNTAHARIRAIGERAIATLECWKILLRLRCCPHRASAIIAAILVLHSWETSTDAG